MKNRIITHTTLYNDPYSVFEKLSAGIDTGITDFLIIDDGSDNDVFNEIESGKKIKIIRHEQNLGYGSSFLTAFNYARDNGYEVLISLDSDSEKVSEDIDILIENINYGFDIVTMSRILENYEHKAIPDEVKQFVKIISDEISSVTGYDLTDPLSLTKAVNVNAIKNMEFVESDPGLFLQMFIQASFSELTIIEVPLASKEAFRKEIIDQNTIEEYMMLIETEKYLYTLP